MNSWVAAKANNATVQVNVIGSNKCLIKFITSWQAVLFTCSRHLRSIKAPNATDSLLRRLLLESSSASKLSASAAASGRNISVKHFNKRALLPLLHIGALFRFKQPICVGRVKREVMFGFHQFWWRGRVNLILSDFNHLMLVLRGCDFVFPDGRGGWRNLERSMFKTRDKHWNLFPRLPEFWSHIFYVSLSSRLMGSWLWFSNWTDITYLSLELDDVMV